MGLACVVDAVMVSAPRSMNWRTDGPASVDNFRFTDQAERVLVRLGKGGWALGRVYRPPKT